MFFRQIFGLAGQPGRLRRTADPASHAAAAPALRPSRPASCRRSPATLACQPKLINDRGSLCNWLWLWLSQSPLNHGCTSWGMPSVSMQSMSSFLALLAGLAEVAEGLVRF